MVIYPCHLCLECFQKTLYCQEHHCLQCGASLSPRVPRLYRTPLLLGTPFLPADFLALEIALSCSNLFLIVGSKMPGAVLLPALPVLPINLFTSLRASVAWSFFTVCRSFHLCSISAVGISFVVWIIVV